MKKGPIVETELVLGKV